MTFIGMSTISYVTCVLRNQHHEFVNSEYTLRYVLRLLHPTL